MGMDVGFYKIVNQEEKCGNCYEFEYESQLGNIPIHEKLTEYYDFNETFRRLNLDFNNYYLFCNYGDILEFNKMQFDRPVELCGFDSENNIEDIDYSDISDLCLPRSDCITELKLEKWIWVIEKYYIRVTQNPDGFNLFAFVDELTNNKFITKDRLKELIYHIPKLGVLLYEYYKVPKDLDFDIFSISY